MTDSPARRQPPASWAPPLIGTPQLVVVAAGSYAALAALISFAGWVFDVPRLATWDNHVSIQPNTCIAAFAAASALLLGAARWSGALVPLGMLVGVIGATTLFEHVSGADLGIDTLLTFGRTWGGEGTVARGRMGIPASISWILIGTGLLAVQRGVRGRRIAAVFAVLVAAIAMLSLTGYLFGADRLYSVPRLTSIAVQTSTMLLAIAVALMAAVPDRQPMRTLFEDSAAGVLTRVALPFIVSSPVLLGLLAVWGQQARLHDTAMGTAMLVLALIGFLCVVLWWGAAAVRRHEVAAAESNTKLQATVRELEAVAAERERLLDDTERARTEAERANRAKDEFLAVLSHELRSPLNAMIGWVRILRRPGTTEAMIARAAETLERNVWAQAQVINDLLDISRITSGKLQLEITRVELTALVAGAVESIRPSASAKQLVLDVQLPERLLDVDGDAARLQQIVGNVLQNAVKFTPERGRVDVRVYADADARAVVEVSDSGEGIEPELLSHVFDRFVQSEASTVRRHGGLGLGLAIVKQLTAMHGGTVTAHSDGKGQGARFTIALPLAPPARVDDDARADTAAGDPPLEGAPLGSLDVLVVEDDADSRDALAIALRHSGASLRLVSSVSDALTAYDARPPDVIVSDIAMSGADGYALIRAIRRREDRSGGRAIAIAITGFASLPDREAALRAGFDDHLAKPVDPGTLLERIGTLASARN